MTTWEPPPLCQPCGARPQNLNIKALLEWQTSLLAICPRCAKGFYQNRMTAVGPRCAGCGRWAHTLWGGVCATCKELGVTALSLFDGSDAV
jgi:protein-arginine kinase activator protein McsA